MPCYQSTNLPSGVTTTGRTSYKTEADCNQACKEGACCEGTTCSVKPQCQCQGTGQVFKGVGTVCSPNPCLCCNNGAIHPSSLIVEITSVSWVSGTYSLSFQLVGTYVIPVQGCFSYRDLFFQNSQPCAPASHPCFAGCSHKLDILVTTRVSSFGILFGLADCDATDNGVRNIAGGEVWGQISSLEQSLCGGQFPIEGTTTQRNNPNYGGVLNAISYRISKP
jgi:hypothetical protein